MCLQHCGLADLVHQRGIIDRRWAAPSDLGFLCTPIHGEDGVRQVVLTCGHPTEGRVTEAGVTNGLLDLPEEDAGPGLNAKTPKGHLAHHRIVRRLATELQAELVCGCFAKRGDFVVDTILQSAEALRRGFRQVLQADAVSGTGRGGERLRHQTQVGPDSRLTRW